MTTARTRRARSAAEATGAQEPADALVVFGITGDLAKVMTFTSLYRLERRGLLDCPIVGVALVIMAAVEDGRDAYIDRLAVRSDQRHRGLAQALLVDAFARGREHGAVRSSLSTDSRTGALGLYEKVGMEVVDVWLSRAIGV